MSEKPNEKLVLKLFDSASKLQFENTLAKSFRIDLNCILLAAFNLAAEAELDLVRIEQCLL